MHGNRAQVLLREALDEPIGTVLGADEHERAPALGTTQLRDERLHLGGVLEVDEAV
jgi:hypothetical protein